MHQKKFNINSFHELYVRMWYGNSSYNFQQYFFYRKPCQ